MPLVALPQLFAVMAQDQPDKLGSAITATFPNESLQLAPGQWLVATVGLTAKELSDKLGVTTGQSGSAVIVAGTSYYGRGNPQIWEWLTSRLGSPNA